MASRDRRGRPNCLLLTPQSARTGQWLNWFFADRESPVDSSPCLVLFTSGFLVFAMAHSIDRISAPRKTISRLIGLILVTVLTCEFSSADDVKPSAAAQREPKIIAVLGDSLAAGYGLEPEEAFPALLQKKIELAGWDFQIVNAGVSGDTSAGGLRRVDWLFKRKVDVLLLELGGNDGLRGIPPENTKTNLQAIIDKAKKKYPGVRIVLAGMQMPDNMGPDYTARFKDVYPALAKENHAVLIDFLLEGVGGKPELNLPDRIHPTAEGHRIVANNVWRVLKPLLESMHASAAQR
jgi:acyl-CoA thioesterase I